MSENNLYAAPESEPIRISLAEQLLEQQSSIGIIVGTFSAAIPCLLLHIILITQNLESFYFYIFAGLIIGLSARFCGRAISWKLPILCGFITLFLIIIAHLIVNFPNGIIFSLPTVIIATLLAKRRLSEQENLALLQWQSQKRQ